MHPRISIITPSYNQGSFLEQTIESVLSQKYSNLEYIIIDGGSSDGSVEIIRKYEKYLKYWESNPDNGQSHAINKGLKHCSGEIFNWLNSDDYYNPDTLHIIAESFLQNKNALLIAGKERAFDSHTNATLEIHPGTKISGDIEELIYQGIIDQPPTFWRMGIIQKLGLLPEQLHFTMDSFWWTKFLLLYGKDNVLPVDDILTNFRIHPGSKSSSQQEKFNKERISIRKELSLALDFHPDITSYFRRETHLSLDGYFDDIKNYDTEKKTKLESCFAKYVYPRYYIEYEHNKAKNCYKVYKKHAGISLQLIIDFIKLIILPKSLLSFLRKKKLSL